ncbi:hypothetical protein RFI_26910 [Reticulomyxa filosa]|uniref:Uncharacterized protein n=1 Tax=Reticulomyxa filosa TaxID=46433 RepID=X6M9B4_RETFI|nr:hypothetical protein RFI_26910 [Reticulomyxa filosa]|eukprot:ETO10464.1 hypothetical protein RFI_26910 [Reticulomyxa filosa]
MDLVQVLIDDIRKRERTDKWNTSTSKSQLFGKDKDEDESSDDEFGSDSGQKQKIDGDTTKKDNDSNNENQEQKQDTPNDNNNQLTTGVTHISSIRNYFFMFVAVAQKKQLGATGLKLISLKNCSRFYIFNSTLYYLWKIANTNPNIRNRIGMIMSDFKTMLQMGIGKSKISA